MQYELIDAVERSHVQAVAAIWTQACGPELAISPRFVSYHLAPATGVTRAGRLAVKDGAPVGFVLASVVPNHPQVMPAQAGWIDALAVRPASGGQGAGSARCWPGRKIGWPGRAVPTASWVAA